MTKKAPKVVASLFSADCGNLAAEGQAALDAGSDGLHIDVMDGHFAKNFCFSPLVVKALRSALPKDTNLDVHLMVYNPFEFIESFVAAGAKSITFHVEATENVEETIQYIKNAGCKVCIAISPETSPSLILKYLDMVDMVLVMTVTPGFSGQNFINSTLETIKLIRSISPSEKLDIQVDGGIDDKTAALCVDAGATVLVSGSYLFEKDMKGRIKKLHSLRKSI